MSPAGYQARITIVDPDPGWPAEARREAAAVAEAVGPETIRVEHVGSTAVPGLAAKPIIDLQLAVPAVDPDGLARRLAPLGYARVPWPGDADDYPFFAKPADGDRTHHVHACVAGSLEERRHVVVRDFLRTHPDEAAAYAELKRELFRRFRGERQGYVDGKDGFMKALEARAMAWAGEG